MQIPSFLSAALVAYSLASLLSLWLYYQDKQASMRGQWRTSEFTLLLSGLLCGWPGALLAQRLFRHKTKKRGFQFVFWLSVVANCATVALLASGKIQPQSLF